VRWTTSAHGGGRSLKVVCLDYLPMSKRLSTTRCTVFVVACSLVGPRHVGPANAY